MELHTMPNGLKVYFNQDNSKHSCLFQLCVNYGGMTSDFEFDGINYHNEDGLAHLIEHLQIEKSMYGNLLQLWSKHHMNLNGGTYKDKTVFWVDAVDEKELALETLIKGINKIVFSKEELEITKRPVLREVNMCEDKIQHKFMNITRQNYSNRSYISTIGTASNVQSFTYDQVVNTISSFYRPSNEMLVVSGNFDKDKVIEIIDRCYSELEFKDGTLVLPNPKELDGFKKNVVDIQANVEIPQVTHIIKMDVSSLTPIEKYRLVQKIDNKVTLNYGLGSIFANTLLNSGILLSVPNISTIIESDKMLIQMSSAISDINIYNREVLNYLDLTHFSKEQFEILKKNQLFESIRPESMSDEADDFISLYSQYKTDEIDPVHEIINSNYEETRNVELDTKHKCLVILKK